MGFSAAACGVGRPWGTGFSLSCGLLDLPLNRKSYVPLPCFLSLPPVPVPSCAPAFLPHLVPRYSQLWQFILNFGCLLDGMSLVLSVAGGIYES